MLRMVATLPGLCAGALLSVASVDSARAETFSVVQNADRFVSLVNGRELRRFGIRLTVTPDGDIIGQAFGSPVTGEWTWEGGYFCRDLFWAATIWATTASWCRKTAIRCDSPRIAGRACSRT
jgi:hypothetical protein